MSATFSNLRTAIKTKLDTLLYNQISNPSGVLMQVKDFYNENFTGFPACAFFMSGNENAFYTNTDNMRGYAFDIYLFFEVESGGMQNAEAVRATVTDSVIALFDTDFNLGGACDFCMPVLTRGDIAVLGGATFLYSKVTLKCQAEIQVVT